MSDFSLETLFTGERVFFFRVSMINLIHFDDFVLNIIITVHNIAVQEVRNNVCEQSQPRWKLTVGFWGTIALRRRTYDVRQPQRSP